MRYERPGRPIDARYTMVIRARRRAAVLGVRSGYTGEEYAAPTAGDERRSANVPLKDGRGPVDANASRKRRAGGRARRGLVAVVAAGVWSPACDRDDEELEAGDPVGPNDPESLQLSGPFNEHGSAHLDRENDLLGITLDDYFFAPTHVEILASDLGRELEVTLLNEGDERHTFTLDELGIDEVLEPGSERTIRMTIENVVPAVYECRFHGEQGMRGALSYEGS